MINRIIRLRKELKLSQEKFAKSIGLSKNFINQFENGKKNLSDRTISDICRVFGVSEDWLRYGIGDMMLSKESSVIKKAVKDVGGDEELEEILRIYLQIEPEIRRPFVRRLLEVVKGIDVNQESKQEEQTIDEEVEELEARKEFDMYRQAREKEKRQEPSA